MTETDLAWAAGFFDGEGCVSARYKHGHWDVDVFVNQTHGPELPERFRDAVGVGRVLGPYITGGGRRKQNAPYWRYAAYGIDDCGHIFDLLDPYLGSVKRGDFEQILNRLRDRNQLKLAV